MRRYSVHLISIIGHSNALFIVIMKFNFFIILFFSSIAFFPAQNRSDFNKVYTETYLKTSHLDLKKALTVADSLYSASEEPYFKVKSLMLSATLLQEAGEVTKAVDFASKAEDLCKFSNDQIQLAEIYGFLSTQYRRLNLYDQSLSYIKKAGEQADQIGNQMVKNNILGLITQENANYEIDLKNYKKAISLIEKSQTYFRQNKTNKALFLASNERLLGDCHYHLKEYDKSLSHYKTALEFLKKFPDNFLKGFIYNGISAVYVKTENTKEAKKYIGLTQKIVDQTQYLDLKKEIYKTSQDYYILEKNLDKFSSLKNKEEALTEMISQKKNSFINTEQTKLLNKNNKLNDQNNLFLILASAVIIAISGIVLFLYNKRKTIGKSKTALQGNFRTIAKVIRADENSIRTIKPEVEEKILKKLEFFEKQNLFIDKGISLASLSIYCDTNTKYLSIVINSHKQKDFNNYINELRIKYLVNKIRTEPRFRKYKIISMADLVGFSTQSKFIEAFKKETSLTPSSFIKSIEG